MSSATETIEKFVSKEYQYGFFTDVECDPARVERRYNSFDLQQEEGTGVHAAMAPEGLSALVDHDGADVAECALSSDRLSKHHLLFCAEAKTDGPKSLDEVDPKLLETYQKLGIPQGTGTVGGGAVDAVFDSVSVATTFREKLGIGHHLCSFSEAVHNHPTW